MVHCPNVKSKAYQSLYSNVLNKLGDKASPLKATKLCYAIWNKSDEGIDDSGFPTIPSILKMSNRLKEYVLSLMLEAERASAEAMISEYIENNPSDTTFGIIKTSTGAEITPDEKTSFVNAFIRAANRLLVVEQNESASWEEISSYAKKRIESLRKLNGDKLNKAIDVLNDNLGSDEAWREVDLRTSYDRSYNKLLDTEAFDQLSYVARRALISSGISSQSGKINAGDKEASSQKTQWNVSDQFNVDEKSGSTAQIKLMMSSLENWESPTLGEPSLFTQDEAYRKILGVLSHLPVKDYGHMIERLKSLSAASSINKNIYQQVVDILEGNNSSQSLRFAFQTAMNKIRSDHMSVLINPKNHSDIRTVSAQMNSLRKIIRNSWLSNIMHNVSVGIGSIQSIKDSSKEFIRNTSDDAVDKYIADNMDNSFMRSLSNSQKKIEARKEILKIESKKLLNSIGIELSDNTWSLLYNGTSKDIYTSTNGLTTGAKYFSAQGNTKTGVFGIIASNLSLIDTRNDNAATVASKIDESVLTFLSNIESLSSDRFASNNFQDYSGNKVYGYANSTPLHKIMGKLAGMQSYVEELLRTEFTKFSYFLDSMHFKNFMVGSKATEPEFKFKFRLAERFGFKQLGTDFKAQKEDMPKVDMYHQSIGLFFNNGAKNCIVGFTTTADKKRSILIEAPREELLAIDKETIIRSSLMDHCMSIVKAEAARIIDLYASKSKENNADSEESNIANKHRRMNEFYGPNYTNNGQFFHAYPFLNKLLKFDDDFNIVPESIASIAMNDNGGFVSHIDYKIRNEMAEYFLSKMEEDLVELEKLGLYQKDSDGNVLFAPIPAKYAASKDASFSEYKNIQLEYSSQEKPKYVETKPQTFNIDVIEDEELFLGDAPNFDSNYSMDDFFEPEVSEIFDDAFGDAFGDGNISFSKNAREVDGYNAKVERILKHLMLELRMNTNALSSNVGMITSGDIATSQRKGSASSAVSSKHKTLIASGHDNNVETKNLAIQLGLDVFVKEHQKRLMAKIAPATDANAGAYSFRMSGKTYAGKGKYKIGFIKDLSTKMWAKDYLSSISNKLGLNEGDLVSKATDGFEYISVFHRLESMFRLGRINEKQFITLRNKYIRDELTNAESELIIIGAEKPRQDGFVSRVIDGKTYRTEVYIKSAEIVLLKQFTRTANKDIDTLRKLLEYGFNEDPLQDKSISRLVHVSAAKIGVQNALDVYNDNGTIMFSNERDLYEALTYEDEYRIPSVSELDWDSYGIQQETPYDPDKTSVARSSQANSSVLAGVKNFTFKYRGKKTNGTVLEAIKDSLVKIKLRRKVDAVKKELGVERRIIKQKKIFDLMKASASSSSIQSNDIMSTYFLVKNKIPLILSNARVKIEQLINSKFSKGVMVPKTHGFSLTQFPMIGEGKVEVKTNGSHIDGLIRVPGYDGSSALKMTSIALSGDKQLSVKNTAEIIVPFKFLKAIAGKYKGANISNFINKDTREIDLNKVPKELLTIIGLRIPNQGHSSQMVFKIVGFSPENMGNVCFVPYQITTQMGSDFDIDKLYTYWKNSFVLKDDRIVTIPKNIVETNDMGDVRINYDVAEAWVKEISEGVDTEVSIDDVINMALEDAYHDIFVSVLSHPAVASMGMAPLDADDLLVLGEENRSFKPKGDFFSWTRQASEYILQQSSRSGIEVFSKIMTGLSVFEGKSVVIGNYVTKNGVSVFKATPFTKFAEEKDGVKLPLLLSNINAMGVSSIEYDGKPHERTGLKNIIIMQSESIDNANRDALVPNNLNEFTFDVAAIMSVLSTGNDLHGKNLDLSYVSRFLNQEAIMMLVDKMHNNKGVMSGGYNPSISSLISEVKYELTQRYNISGNVTLDKNRTYSSKDLLALMKDKGVDVNRYVESQFDMLDMFKDLKSKSKVLQSYNRMSAYDKDGMRPTVEENEDVLLSTNISMDYLNSSTSNPNASLTTVVDVNGTVIEKPNASSDSIVQGRSINEIVSNSMGHTSNNSNYIMHGLSLLLEKYLGASNKRKVSDKSINGYTSEVKALMLKSLYSFLTSKSSLLGNIKISDLTKSKILANSYYELKNRDKYPELRNNIFFNSLQVSDNLEHLSINATFSDDTFSDKVARDFISMYRSSDAKIREFSENIIKYELLSGGTQGPSRMMRYIDPHILNNAGYYSDLKDNWNMFMSGAYMDEFIDLFFANNPQLFRSRSLTNGSLKVSNKKFGSDEGGYHYVKSNSKYYKATSITASGEKDTLIFYTEVKLRGSELEKLEASKDKKNRFKKPFIPKYSDYSSEKIMQSVIFSIEDITGEDNSDTFEIFDLQDVQPDVEEQNYSKNMSDIFQLESLIYSSKDIPSILSEFVDDDSTVSTSVMLNILNTYPVFNKTRIVSATNTQSAVVYNTVENVIYVNYGRLATLALTHNNPKLVEEAIVHEIIHAIHTRAYLLGKNNLMGFQGIYNDTNSLFLSAIRGVRDLAITSVIDGSVIADDNGVSMTYDRFLGGSKLLFTMKDGSKTSDIDQIVNSFYEGDKSATRKRNELKQALNAFTSPIEFSAEISSRKQFQSTMKTILLSNEESESLDIRGKRKSLYDKFLSLIVDLFHFLRPLRVLDENGVEIDGKSIMEGAIINNFNAMSAIIDNANLIDQNNSIFAKENIEYNFPSSVKKDINEVALNGTISEYLRSASRDARAGFRALINNGLIKTKCN